MKTKKFIYLSAVMVSIMLSFTSCDLNLGPIDYYGNANFWKTLPQVQSYVNGMNMDLRATNFDRQFILGETRGGLLMTGTSSQGLSPDHGTIKKNALTGDDTGVSGWVDFYGKIFDCNVMIQNVENSNLHNNNKKDVDYLLAQTYGIRALYYFTLYRTYGGVPLVSRVKVLDGQVKAADLYTARATPKETMDFIKADIQKSLDYFASAGKEWTNNVTWSKAATQMLGAQTYLWSAKVTLGNQTPDAGDLAKAESFLNDVKGNSRFELISDYSKIFDSATKTTKK